MHRIYLAWDRQPSTQSWIQKNLLLRGSDFSRIGWRLLRSLMRDVPVLMVLAGGLPYNARLLYGAREFVQALPIRLWKIRKRRAQKELMEILMKPEGGVWPPEQGEIPPGTLQAIRRSMAAWGLPPEGIESALQRFQEEFRRPNPYRKRLFHVLVDRIIKKGKPLILLGIGHSETAPYVQISEPVEISGDSDPAALAQRFGQLSTF